MEGKKLNPVDELALKTNRSRVAIYKLMRRMRRQGIKRLPTIEEVVNRKVGRPRIYKED